MNEVTIKILNVVGISFVAFSSAWLGWSFQFSWEDRFLWMILLLIIGAILSILN